jgi:hypothetical protein
MLLLGFCALLSLVGWIATVIVFTRFPLERTPRPPAS